MEGGRGGGYKALRTSTPSPLYTGTKVQRGCTNGKLQASVLNESISSLVYFAPSTFGFKGLQPDQLMRRFPFVHSEHERIPELCVTQITFFASWLLSGIASSKWVRDCIQGGKYGFALPAVMVLKEVRVVRVTARELLPRCG